MLSAAGVRSAHRYGIKNIQVLGSSSRLVVQDCTEAEENNDARDKFFMRALRNRAQPDIAVCGVSFSKGGRPGIRCKFGNESRGEGRHSIICFVDLGAAAMAKNTAALLSASSAHLGGLLAELYTAMPTLSACGFAGSLAAASKNNSMLTVRSLSSGSTSSHAQQDSVGAAVSSVTAGLGVDMGSVEALLTKAKSTVAQISR